jgi:hypothetical protein
MTSIYRNTFIKFGLAASMLMAAAGGAFAQTSHSRDYMAYSAYPTQSWVAAHAANYNLLVGPGVTTVGIEPGDSPAPLGAD